MLHRKRLQVCRGLRRCQAPVVNTTTTDTIVGMLVTDQVNYRLQSIWQFGSLYCSTAAHIPLLTAGVASRTRLSWRWWRRPAGSSLRQ